MFGLKGAYFYFIALQITLIKFFKKIYFTTIFYNNSLRSETPTQFYFNPNPFLLSIISPYKKKSFKIENINQNDFWLKIKDNQLQQQHNFLWLNLIDRKIDGKNIQKIVFLWMLKNSSFRNKIWDNEKLSSRIVSWILNIDIIIDNGAFEFKRMFFQNIISQCNHIKKILDLKKIH